MQCLFGVLCFCLLQVAAVNQEDFALIGTVVDTDQHGVGDATVKIIGEPPVTTSENGEFRIPLSKELIGQRIYLEVYKKGWIVDYQRDLTILVPADPVHNPIRIMIRLLELQRPLKLPAESAYGTQQLTEFSKVMDKAKRFREHRLYDESLNRYQEALEIARNAKNRSWEMKCLSEIGSLQLLSGKHIQAGETFTLLRSLATEHSPEKYLFFALVNLGEIERLHGNLTRSLQHYQEALALARTIGSRYKEAYVLQGLGKLAKTKGDSLQSEEYYQSALGIYRQVGNKRQEARVLFELSELSEKIGNLSKASEYLEEAFGLIDHHMNYLESPPDTASPRPKPAQSTKKPRGILPYDGPPRGKITDATTPEEEVIAIARKQVAEGHIAFKPPEEMVVSKIETLEARLTYQQPTDALTQGLKGGGQAVVAPLKVSSRMKITLVGADDVFKITPITPGEVRLIDKQEPYSSWKWEIMPKRPGTYDIHLIAEAVIPMPDKKDQLKYERTFDYTIRVKVTKESIIYWAGLYWQYILGTILIPLLGAAWRLYSKRKEEAANKTLPPDPPKIIIP